MKIYIIRLLAVLLFSTGFIPVYSQIPALIKSDVINLRNYPKTEYSSVIATLPFGTLVFIISSTEHMPPDDPTESYLTGRTFPWFEIITLQQDTGWIYGKNILTIPFNTTASIIDIGLYTNSVLKSANFTTEDMGQYYLNLPVWSYYDSYIPDRYDIVLYIYNGSDTTLSELKLEVQIDQKSGRKSEDLIAPSSAKWITNIRRFNRDIPNLASGELRRIVISNISFNQDLIREQQLLPSNWIWAIRAIAYFPNIDSQPQEQVIEIIHGHK